MIDPSRLRWFALSLFLFFGCGDQAPTSQNGATVGENKEGKSSPEPTEGMMAIMGDDSGTLQELINDGLDPNGSADAGRPDVTFLHLAAMNGGEASIRTLVKAGAEIDATTDLKMTPLLGALVTGSPQNGLVLIELGADVNLANLAGAAPLHFAASQGNLELVKALVDQGADVNLQTKTNGGTALSAAADADSKEVIEYLLQHGADKTIKDRSGKTPVTYAKSDAVRELLTLDSDDDR